MRKADNGRGIARITVCIAALALPACYQGSEPLTPATADSRDARLNGDWRCIRDDGDDVVSLSVRAGDTGRHDVTLRAPGEDPDRYVAHVSRFGDVTLANVQEVSDGQPKGSWVYVRYRFPREGLLDLDLVSEERLQNAKTPSAALDEIRARAADDRLYETLIVCVRARPAR